MRDTDPGTGDEPEVKRLTRHGILRRLTSLYDRPRYLEVGVFKGVTFTQVPAATKVAVDPSFSFDIAGWARDQAGVTFHEVTSDEYFARIVEPDAEFDVIYLDGLHTVEQTLRDLTNALHHLQPRGVIVVDDTRPPTYAASLRDQQDAQRLQSAVGGEKRLWMGDVFKLVHFVETFFPSLSYRTLLNNHGQTVIWRARREPVPRTLGEVDRLEFQHLVLDPEPLRLARFADVRDELRADLGL